MKLSKLVEAYNVINAVLAQYRDGKLFLSVPAQFRLTAAARAAEPFFQQYNSQLLEFLKEFGELDEKNDQYSIKQESPNRPQFDLKFNQLKDEDVDIEFKTITVEDFEGTIIVKDGDKSTLVRPQIELALIVGLLEAGIIKE